MTRARIVGFSGNITRPSKTLAFVDHIVQEIGRRNGLPARSWDIEDLGPSLVSARRATALDEPAQTILQAITEADVLVIGSPTYKGSYTGLFKHFFDLLDPSALQAGALDRHRRWRSPCADRRTSAAAAIRFLRSVCAADGRLCD